MRMLGMCGQQLSYHDDPPHMDECGGQDESTSRSQTAGRKKDGWSIENADQPTNQSAFHIADHRPLPYQPSSKVCPVKVCAGGELLDFGLIA